VLLQEGPPVVALRASLDNRMLAVQRSTTMLELVDLTRGNCFVHSIHKAKGEILTFFFSESPSTDLVIVTTRAIEMMQFAARCGTAGCALVGVHCHLCSLRGQWAQLSGKRSGVYGQAARQGVGSAYKSLHISSCLNE
jgi:hypothetical protein